MNLVGVRPVDFDFMLEGSYFGPQGLHVVLTLGTKLYKQYLVWAVEHTRNAYLGPQNLETVLVSGPQVLIYLAQKVVNIICY